MERAAELVRSIGAQRIEERSESDKIVRNSPYGADRPKYGWGNVFKPPTKCFSDVAPFVYIGLSSLNAVPTKQREMPAMMEHYMKKFNCLEHCAPYHRINEHDTWVKWKGMPGKRPFLFTVKCNEYLTHMRQLEVDADTISHINTFFGDRCAVMAERLGAVLLQLPPQFKRTDTHMDRIRSVAAAIPAHIPIAVEFRNKSWFNEDVYELLRQIKWTLVLTHNEDIGESPEVDTGTDLMYVRLHGAVSRYVGDYGPMEMKRWAERVYNFVAVNPTKRKVFFFLNNNESHVANETSSVVDATMLAVHLKAMIEAQPFPKPKPKPTTTAPPPPPPSNERSGSRVEDAIIL